MFTGLIRELGFVESYQDNILKIKAKHIAKIGDSIAINGVCLTVISIFDGGFCLELADETRSIIDESKILGRVHIEPAMMMNDRFEGHIVQGHIDCMGKIIEIIKRENATDFIIEIEDKNISYIVPKGSITIDGISLTVNDVYSNSFRITIIPHTITNTLFFDYKIGTLLNIETDMFARYISHILDNRKDKKLDWNDIDNISILY